MKGMGVWNPFRRKRKIWQPEQSQRERINKTTKNNNKQTKIFCPVRRRSLPSFVFVAFCICCTFYLLWLYVCTFTVQHVEIWLLILNRNCQTLVTYQHARELISARVSNLMFYAYLLGRQLTLALEIRDTSTTTNTWVAYGNSHLHACKYKVHKLHQVHPRTGWLVSN